MKTKKIVLDAAVFFSCGLVRESAGMVRGKAVRSDHRLRSAGMVRGKAVRPDHRLRSAGMVRIFDFLRIRTRFRTARPENEDDTTNDGAENEKIPNPHLSDLDTSWIIGNKYLLVYNDTDISDNIHPDKLIIRREN